MATPPPPYKDPYKFISDEDDEHTSHQNDEASSNGNATPHTGRTSLLSSLSSDGGEVLSTPLHQSTGLDMFHLLKNTTIVPTQRSSFDSNDENLPDLPGLLTPILPKRPFTQYQQNTVPSCTSSDYTVPKFDPNDNSNKINVYGLSSDYYGRRTSIEEDHVANNHCFEHIEEQTNYKDSFFVTSTSSNASGLPPLLPKLHYPSRRSDGNFRYYSHYSSPGTSDLLRKSPSLSITTDPVRFQLQPIEDIDMYPHLHNSTALSYESFFNANPENGQHKLATTNRNAPLLKRPLTQHRHSPVPVSKLSIFV